MGAVPKSRVGPRRKRLRRTHYKLFPVTLTRCGNCNEFRQAHHMCPACGTYKGVQIIEMENEG